MLESEDEWTRRASIVSLAELGDRCAVRKIMRMQREDESNLVRQVADEALEELILSGH
ncbi:MAG UNVERIFIED_CONTAM: HEAT repeat domain-containing protein [Anaerolineae bacterium]|jgi:HEAT repeat protein